MTDHLSYLAAHRQTMLDDLEAFITRETPSDDKPLLDAFAAYLAGYARTIGKPSVETISVASRGNHLRIRWQSEKKQPPILLLAHYDTVWPERTLESLPFHVEDEIARGPGVFDMKGGMLQGFWALRSLHEHGRLPLPITFLCTSDEEIGSETSRELIEREAREAAAVLVLEPSAREDGSVITSRKGVGMFKIDIEGRAVHAGRDFFSGVSATDELAHLTLALHALTDKDAGTTVNVGVVSGGTRSNVVAANAWAKVDIRATSQDEMERVSAKIRAMQPHHPEARLTISGGGNRPPMGRSEATAELFAKARAAAATIGIELHETFTGGGSDANFCAALGRPVLDGMGAVGGGAHAVTEHVMIDEIPRRAALLAALLESL